MRYLYAMRSRSINVDDFIKKGFEMMLTNKDLGDCDYYYLLIYDRKLKDEEFDKYQLEYLGGFNY